MYVIDMTFSLAFFSSASSFYNSSILFSWSTVLFNVQFSVGVLGLFALVGLILLILIHLNKPWIVYSIHNSQHQTYFVILLNFNIFVDGSVTNDVSCICYSLFTMSKLNVSFFLHLIFLFFLRVFVHSSKCSLTRL